MRQLPLQYVKKALHAKFDPVTKEPLPKRWVELIHYLNEMERREQRRDPPDKAKRGRTA